jgi:hypothetical protein
MKYKVLCLLCIGMLVLTSCSSRQAVSSNVVSIESSVFIQPAESSFEPPVSQAVSSAKPAQSVPGTSTCNCERLQIENYCEKTGSCIDLTTPHPSIGGGCASKTRICCNYVVTAMQRVPGRIKVIFVNEYLGY